MTDTMDVDDTRPLMSPWPLLVALGFALSEFGVLFGFVPIAVGGILLFGGSVAGITRDAKYVRTLWTPLAIIGLLFVLIGIGVWGITLPRLSLNVALQSLETNQIAFRGASILAGGVLLTGSGVLGYGFSSRINS